MNLKKLQRLNEIIIELNRQRGLNPINLAKLCFPKQLGFIEDKAPFATAVTSRRAGKTTACALHLLDTVTKHAGIEVLYLTLSRLNASKIVWPILKKFNRELRLGGVANETLLSVKFPNGSIINCSGAKDQREIDKFLGRALKLVYIDEAQSFKSYIEDLIDRVIAPALMDHAGHLRIIGTPGPIPVGPFWDLANSNNWSHHSWTYFDNPWIETLSGTTHMQLLERELTRKGIKIDNPTIQREWFGKWVHDSDSLVYKFNTDLNTYTELPRGKYNYVLGIDLGYEDADALAVLAWSDIDKTTYLVEEVVTHKQGITDLTLKIEELRKKYDFYKVVMDMGGLGKKIAEEIIRRYQIPIMPAEKSRKFENIELFNDSLRTAKFRAPATSQFAQDAMLMEWDTDKSTPERLVVSDRFHSDICDAVLYAWRESYSFTSEKPESKPKWGTLEWQLAERVRMEEEAEEYFKKLEESQSYPNPY